MPESTRSRWLTALSLLTVRHPRRVLVTACLVVLGFAALIPGIQVTTSRYSLVSADNPYQARLFAFFERFGYPDTPVLVLTGGSDKERRSLVDRLEQRLEREPIFAGRVMARIDPERVAEVLLLHQPEALSALRPFLAKDQDLADLIDGGLPAMAQVMHRQMEAVVASDQLQTVFAFGTPADTARQAIGWLAVLVRALDAALAGEPAWPGIMEPAGAQILPADQGMDRRGYLVGRAAKHHLIAIFADLPGDDVSQLRPVVERIRAIRDEVLAESGLSHIQINLTGLPALSVDEHQVILRGLLQSSLAAGAAVLLLFLLVFRSLRQTGMALLPLALGVVMTLATARLLFGGLNLITSAAAAILLGLGIDFAVHATSRYNESLRHGALPAEAVKSTLAYAGPAILTSAATTALAFLTTTITEFTAFAELGTLTTLGLIYILIATFFLVPPLLVWGSRQQMPVAPELPGATALARLARHAPLLTLSIALVAAIAGAVVLPRLSFNVRYFDFLPAHTESAIALNELEEDGLMGPTFAFASAEGVETARDMAARLRALPSVAAVQTATDLMPPLGETALAELRRSLATSRPPDFHRMVENPGTASQLIGSVDGIIATLDRLHFLRQLSGRPVDFVDDARVALVALRERLESLEDEGGVALSAVGARFAGMLERAWNTAQKVAQRGYWHPSDLPDLFRARFVSKDSQALALFVYPSLNVWQRDQAQVFSEQLESVDPHVSGTAINLHEHSRMVLSGFKRAAVLAAVLILVILLVDFRSLRDTLLALAPLVCAWLWMLGVMGAFGIRFDFANIVALPLVPGIGIAAGVHLMHRCRQSATEHGGVARIEEILRGTGTAVFVAATTTVFGFAGLMLADYGGMISLGLIMSIGTGSCLLGALIVQPALLVLVGRAR